MRAGKAAAVIVMLFALAGCTPPPTASEPQPTATAKPLLEAGTVVATAEFDPAEGTTGSIELVYTDRGNGMFELRISGFSTTITGNAELMMSPYPLGPERTCLDKFGLMVGPLEPGPDHIREFSFDEEYLGAGDPSFLDGVVIGQLIEADRVEHDCHKTIVARAPFMWDMPDLRPDLVVSDSGHTGGATGEATTQDGVPVSYLVAPGDVLEEIAARFDISVSDINYLNPGRGPSEAIEGEVLNLDKTQRSGPLDR